MKHGFKVGDRVTWNSEAGRVSGTTDHIALHKGPALKRANT